MRKIGKQGKINMKANKKIAELWEYHQINYCEARLVGCLGNWPLQNAHRKRRNEYYNEPEKLWDFNEVLRLCQNCHQEIDKRNPQSIALTEELFDRLRE